MKLLIVTQKVDRTDSVLGFFHRWIEEFAKECSRLTVIGQLVGTHHLPGVSVHSLGKEHGVPRWRQILRFWSLIIRERASYDAVFIHMTPVWVVLGAPVWMVLRKRVYLWYEVRRGGSVLRLATLLSRKVFSATAHGLPWTSPKNVVVGHGIDTGVYTPEGRARERGLLVAAGRITPVKRFDVLIRALSMLPDYVRLQIVGTTVTEDDRETMAALRQLMHDLKLHERVKIGPSITPDQMPALLRRADLHVHACEGGLDKVILEAMACGCPTVSIAVSAQDVLPAACRADESTLAQRIADLLKLPEERRWDLERQCRDAVEKNHSLQSLVPRLVRGMA